ncbi:MAG: CapA family protein [Ectobacillus sp.]
MNFIKRVIISSILLIICLGVFWLGNLQANKQPAPAKGIKPPEAGDKTNNEGKDYAQVTLSAVGDVLLHAPVYNDARTDVDRFNFRHMFAAVKPYIEQSDFSFVNQESIIGGIEIGLSTYPSFNSPVEIADALKGIGFDVVNLANNHALDRGEHALVHSLSYWDKLGLTRTGAYTSQEDRNHIRTISKNGITLSILSYTYGTNGIKIPKPYLVNTIDRDSIQRDVEKAKQLSDAVVIMLHFGTEYEKMPNAEQTQLAQFLSNLGVSVIFGHHPHVLQPPALLTGKDGNHTIVFYSLGNFLAGQEKEETWFGGIASITVTKDATGNVELANPSFLPTFTYSQNKSGYRVLPLQQVKEEQAPNAREQYDAVIAHMKTFLPDLQIIPAH